MNTRATGADGATVALQQPNMNIQIENYLARVGLGEELPVSGDHLTRWHHGITGHATTMPGTPIWNLAHLRACQNGAITSGGSQNCGLHCHGWCLLGDENCPELCHHGVPEAPTEPSHIDDTCGCTDPYCQA